MSPFHIISTLSLQLKCILLLIYSYIIKSHPFFNPPILTLNYITLNKLILLLHTLTSLSPRYFISSKDCKNNNIKLHPSKIPVVLIV
nr:MAG TPA: hypothetical protein [Caudoviricetes sp.]